MCMKEMFLGTFEEAKDYCINLKSGNLVRINGAQENSATAQSALIASCSTAATDTDWNPDIFLGIENGTWLDPPQYSVNYNCYAPGQKALNGSSVLRRIDIESSYYWYKTITTASIVCTWKQSTHCINEYSYISKFNICVKVVNISSNALMAYQFCNMNNRGSLVIPSSMDRNEFFYSLVKSSLDVPFGNFTWLGMSTEAEAWLDSTPVTYTNFIEPPTNETIANPHLCLAMSLEKGTASKWLYVPCLNSDYNNPIFICQYTP